MLNRTTSRKLFAPKRKVQRILTADFRRLSQMRIRTFHRRDAEYAEEIPFAESGDDDWAKTYSSDLKNVFVCRCLPTNKKLILCALCASAVIFLKEFLSVSICVNLRLIAFDALRESSFVRFPQPNLNGKFQICLVSLMASTVSPFWHLNGAVSCVFHF